MVALVGGILLAAGVMAYLLEPVFSGRAASAYGGEDEHDERAARRQVALTALRDLEYDRATGKLDGADYRALRDELSRDALRQLGPDDAAAGKEEGPPPAGHAARASAELEDEIARMRAAIGAGLECGACGHLNRLGARFCAGCGGSLRRAARERSG